MVSMPCHGVMPFRSSWWTTNRVGWPRLFLRDWPRDVESALTPCDAHLSANVLRIAVGVALLHNNGCNCTVFPCEVGNDCFWVKMHVTSVKSSHSTQSRSRAHEVAKSSNTKSNQHVVVSLCFADVIDDVSDRFVWSKAGVCHVNGLIVCVSSPHKCRNELPNCLAPWALVLHSSSFCPCKQLGSFVVAHTVHVLIPQLMQATVLTENGSRMLALVFFPLSCSLWCEGSVSREKVLKMLEKRKPESDSHFDVMWWICQTTATVNNDGDDGGWIHFQSSVVCFVLPCFVGKQAGSARQGFEITLTPTPHWRIGHNMLGFKLWMQFRPGDAHVSKVAESREKFHCQFQNQATNWEPHLFAPKWSEHPDLVLL